MLCNQNVFITSDNTINARRVDDDNARTIASLASSPPVVSGVGITPADAMVIAHIERKPERLCVGDEFEEVGYVVQKGLRARRHLKD